jgi:hypothetical protein
MATFAAYTTKTERSWRRVIVHGMDVAYEYERADPDVGLPEAYLLAAIEMGGKWVTFDAFREDFWEVIQAAIPEAVRRANDEARV